MRDKPWVRGAVWIVVGLAVWLVSALAFGRTLVVRGTQFPWGAGVMVAGAAILVWDVVKARRHKTDASSKSR